jgi:hypothetical protein
MKTIRIDIAGDGTVAIDAAGFSGPDCEQATKFLEEALGQVRERKLKPEHRRRATVQRRQSLGNGEVQS